MEDIFEVKVITLEGEERLLAEFRGKVLLIVNVASKCGYTPQYTGLEELYRRYKERGFEILAFPCNQFGNQEPGNSAEIKAFCSTTYDVSFTVFAKIEVNGEDAHPLYKILKRQAPGILGTEFIKWNFTKFLLDRDGRVAERFAPAAEPAGIAARIESLL